MLLPPKLVEYGFFCKNFKKTTLEMFDVLQTSQITTKEIVSPDDLQAVQDYLDCHQNSPPQNEESPYIFVRAFFMMGLQPPPGERVFL